MRLFNKILRGSNDGKRKQENKRNKPPKIRVQFIDFKLEHFDIAPIWEFAIDEEGEENQDETTLKPLFNVSIADPHEGMLIIKAEFETMSGEKYMGLCTPYFDYYLGNIQPHIFTDKGLVGFWYGMFPPKKEEIEYTYNQLNESAETLFPIKFKALTPAIGAKLEGVIEGFMYKVEDKIGIIK